ncbi:MAG TPA: glycosyltransferase family 1 protein [Syntrophobacteria bacterium]|nr:glycosyltransferase family 1 protein [Syntrophobacteria bacterium]
MIPNKPIRIGIDGTPLHGNPTGIGRYIVELSQEVDKLLPHAEFYVYSLFPIQMPVASDRWVHRIVPLVVPRFLRLRSVLKFYRSPVFERDSLDVFWGAGGFLPRLPRRVRTLLTVYDLGFKVVPETLSVSSLWTQRLFLRRDVAEADVVYTISYGTAERLYNVSRRRADGVIQPSISRVFTTQSDHRVAKVLEGYGIQTPYILSVATWEPRKNLRLLISTFLRMRREGLLDDYTLVLVGPEGWKERGLEELTRQQQEHGLKVLGYVPDEDLPALYAGAKVFVFPSRYEGFGIPVLEARAAGTRVVTTDIPELREAGGESAIYITPNREGLRDGIFTALSRRPDAVPTKALGYPTWKDGAKILAEALLRLGNQVDLRGVAPQRETDVRYSLLNH